MKKSSQRRGTVDLRSTAKVNRLGSRVSFRVKLMLLAMLVAMVPLGVVGLVVHRITEKQLTETNQELLFTILDDVSSSLGASFESVDTLLDAVARTLIDEGRTLDERIELATIIVGASRASSAVAIYDENGAWIDSIALEAKAAPLPKQLDLALTAAASQRGRAIGPVRSSSGGVEGLIVVPVTGTRELWFAATRVPIDRVQRRVHEIAEQRLQPHHRLLVVDNRLTILASGDEEEIGVVASPQEVGALKGLDADAVDENLLYFGAFDGKAGHTVGAVQTVKGTPWAAVVELPYGDAYESLRFIRNSIFAVFGAAIFLACFVGIGMAWRITRPIKLLLDFASDLAQRRFDRRVHIGTRDELSLLGDALSDAAAELEESDERLREEVAIRSDLGRYLPTRLVDEIVTRRATVELGGERRLITVLFADVVGFTPLAEKQGANEVVNILNELFSILSEIVFRHEGTIDKFIGDCVMAFWGAPDPQEDHASRAVAAAEDMLRWLEVGNAAWKEKYGVEIELAIGVHTGDAVVGNFGLKTRMAYTAIGDTVNVAARLEVMARPQQILISRATRDAAGDEFDYGDIGSQQLAGRKEPVELYEVIA